MVTFNDSGPALKEEQVQEYERLVGHPLPQEYRNFLLTHNGGKPNPNYAEYLDAQGPYSDASVRVFYGINGGPYYDLSDELSSSRENELLPDNIIPIGEDEGGNMICLSVAGEDTGKIYFWDHEQSTEPPDYSNLHLLAISFDGFLDRLQDPPDYDVNDRVQINQIVATRDTYRLEKKIRSGWDMNELNFAGLSLLESVVMQNNLEIADCLLRSKAQPRRALELAENGEKMGLPCQEMIALLKKYIA